jgi:hypothetical protein
MSLNAVIDRNALRKKVDLEVQQLSFTERQFVKTIVTVQPDCPLWLREQLVLALSGCVELEPTSPVAQAVMALTVSCSQQSEMETCQVVAQRELLRALDLTEKVVVAAEFLQRLITDIASTISEGPIDIDDNFVNRNVHV